jgi:hypothetical protein
VSQIFLENCLQIKMQFFRSSSRRRSTEASSSSGSIHRSYVEPSASSMQDATIKSCLWPCNDFMVSAGIKEVFDQYVHNAEDNCFQHLNLTETFTKKFKYLSRESRVSFSLYNHPFTMPLELFCNACKIPFWVRLTNRRNPNMSNF